MKAYKMWSTADIFWLVSSILCQ